MPIRVLIAEDHALFREGTRRILEQQRDIVVVGEAEDGFGAVAMSVLLRPDVTLLDLQMGGISGVEAAHQIHEQVPETAILILSAYDDDHFVRALIKAGAVGYLLKTIKADDLVQAVRRVHDGETVLHPAIAQKLGRLLSAKPDSEADETTLTPKEVDVLRCVCRGLRSKEIARDLAMSVRTVDGHLESIFSKLGLRSRTEVAVYATSRGWFSDDVPSSGPQGA